MSFLRRLFGGKAEDGGDVPPTMPWDQGPSILEFVRSHVAEGKPGMTTSRSDQTDGASAERTQEFCSPEALPADDEWGWVLISSVTLDSVSV